jgi:hypothetical protein
MFGRGTRTTTAPGDAAGKQSPGVTSSKSRDNKPFAEGGEQHMALKRPAAPAKPGQTAAAIGGEARPARPGRCAP